MLVRKYGDWTEAEVCDWIARYDAKWGSEPTTLDLAMVGAFENASEELSRAARYAANELAAIENDRRALAAAQRMFHAGIRPEQQEDGTWRVRSETGRGVYQVTRFGACTCPDAVNRNRTCKHAKLVSITEQANEYRDAHDDYDVDSDYARAARKALGIRLTMARRVYVEAI